MKTNFWHRAAGATPCGLLLPVITFWLALSASAAPPPVTFPDPNLEQAVRNALGLSAATPITRAAMATLTNLNVSYSGITNLGGLEAGVNLQVLDVTANPFFDLGPLTGLTSLIELRTPYCQVTNAAPVAGLTNLVFLDIGWNRSQDGTDNSIRDGGFLTNLLRLKWISLYYLRLTDLAPLANLTALTNLNISFNYESQHLDVLNGLTNLAELYLTAEQVSNINFVANMPHLNRLDCGYNSVSDLSPALGLNLVGLWAYSDPLTNAQLATNFPALEVLHLDDVGLTSGTFIGGLSHLYDLSLDGNSGLSNFSFLTGLTNLTYLSLGRLGISDLTPLTPLERLGVLHLDNDPNLSSLTPLIGFTDLHELDLGNSPGPDFTVLSNLVGLTSLRLENDGLATAPFVTAIADLDYLDLSDNYFDNLASLAGSQIGELDLPYNSLTDISSLLLVNGLYYTDLRHNFLDFTPGGAASNVLSALYSRGVSVDYLPQDISPTLTIWEQPAGQCVAAGANVYFAVAASTSAGGGLYYQWQFNGADLPGENNAVLWRSAVTTNQAGQYRVVLYDINGGLASASAQLYVGDTNCGLTVSIQQQPLNVCAAPADDVAFSVQAVTLLTNLYYQWQFNGTNLDAQTNFTLNLYGVTFDSAGLYQALVWDDSSNVVASAIAELKVVDQVTFADPNLAAQVISALGLSPGFPMYLSDLDNLSSLDISGQGITSLAGLDCARNLTYLYADNNPLGDASPLRWATSLQSLSLRNDGLQEASFLSGLTNLYSADLGNDYAGIANANHIHSIPRMDKLPALAFLELNYNSTLVNTPRLAPLSSLMQLSLHDDDVPELSFVAGLNALTTLDVGGDWLDDPDRGAFSDLSPLAGKTNLVWLSLTYGEATNMEVIGNFSGLQFLFLSGNHFSSVDFLTNMPLLAQLAIDQSEVTNLNALAGHPHLDWLNLSSLATTNLGPVSDLTSLTSLWAGGNHAGSAAMLAPLIRLSYVGFDHNDVADVSPLSGTTNLVYLNLEWNELTNVGPLAAKTNLGNLYLTGNRILDLAPLSDLTNLSSLSLSANGFAELAPLSALSALQWLMLQSNHIANIAPLAGLTNLSSGLDLSGNEITNLDAVTNFPALSWLGVWQNQLTTLPPLARLTNITSFDFSNNRLTNVSGLSGMSQVTWLSFVSNNLATIQPLPGLTNVNSLDAHANHLVDLSNLADLTGLNWLYLSDNDLQDIQPLTTLPGHNLYYVDVTRNWLALDPNSAAATDIQILQSQGVYVNYLPQKTLVLGAPAWVGDHQFQFSVTGPAGSVVSIYGTAQGGVSPAKWGSFVGFLTNQTGTAIFTDSHASGSQQFYQAVR